MTYKPFENDSCHHSYKVKNKIHLKKRNDRKMILLLIITTTTIMKVITELMQTIFKWSFKNLK